MVAKSAAIHYSQQNTKTQTGEALNRKTKGKHHTKQNNKTLNTLTPHEHNTNTTLTHTNTTHESIKQLNIKHESLAIMNLWTLLPGNIAKFDRGRTRIK